MNKLARVVSLLVAAGLALIAFVAPAAPAHADRGKYISQEYHGTGYVDVFNIRMNSGVFSFLASFRATSGSLAINPLYWSAKADDGTTYSSPDYSETTLQSGDLPAGERTRGTVAFEADGPKPTMIILEDILGGRLATFHFKWKTKTPPASPFGSFGS